MAHYPYAGPEPPQVLMLGRLLDIEAVRHLQLLQKEGKLKLLHVEPAFSGPEELLAIVKEKIRGCSAIICRPTRGACLITDDLIAAARKPFYVATISTGTDHIEAQATEDLMIISDTSSSNAPSVAELSVLLAASLLRPFHLCALAPMLGYFDNRPFASSRRLEGLTWAAIGSGAQVNCLIARLLGWGVSRFLVFNPLMDSERFQRCLRAVSSLAMMRPLASEHTDVDFTAQLGRESEHGMEVHGTRNMPWALSQADVVSIHLPLTSLPDGEGRPATRGLINESTLAQMKDGAILLNMSRGDIVVEEHVLSALGTQKLGGYGADVVCSKAERSGLPDDSPLWSASMLDFQEEPLDPGGRLNMILTPHVGGTTRDALERAAAGVLGTLLSKLGVLS